MILDEAVLIKGEEMPEVVDACPECVAGKHPNCDGWAWSNAQDCYTSCPCWRGGHPKKEESHG